jgi:hypothetical protein
MKKEAILLLIAVSALLLIHTLLYFDYQAIIVINILILIGGISTAIGAIIGMRDTFKWLNEGSSDKKKEKGKEND